MCKYMAVKKMSYKDSYFSYVLLYGFYYASMALASALISVYIMDKGYSANHVSFVVAMSFLMAAVGQPLVAEIQNVYETKRVNAVLLIIGAAGCIGIILAQNIIVIAGFYSLVMTMFYSVNPIVERIATRSRHPYGSVRMWGTIGYSCGAQVAGLIYQYISPAALYTFCALSFILSVVGLMGTMEILPKTKEKSVKTESQNQYYSLMKNHFFVIYLWITAIYYGVSNLINTYCASMFQNDGISVDIVSTILLIACLCEIPVVLFSHRFMNQISNQKLLLIANGMVVVQTLMYWIPVPLFGKIVITFLTKHPSAMLLIMVNLKVINTIVTKQEQVSALALVLAVRNLSSVLFHLAAGELLVRYSYSFLFFWCFVVVVIGMVLIGCFRIADGNDQVLFHS